MWLADSGGLGWIGGPPPDGPFVNSLSKTMTGPLREYEIAPALEVQPSIRLSWITVGLLTPGIRLGAPTNCAEPLEIERRTELPAEPANQMSACVEASKRQFRM